MVSKPPSSGLGSLAQSARGKQLSQARWILIAVGVLTIGLNGFLLYNAPNEVKEALDKDVQQHRNQGRVVPPGEYKAAEERILRFCYLVYGGTLALGVVFVILGAVVQTFPVVATILGLVLYVGVQAVFAVIDPTNLYRGWAFKLVIILSLFKAVQSAIAYQKEAAIAPPEPEA